MNNPTEEHMEAAYRILRYLNMTPGQGLFFKKIAKKEVEIFTDADWAGSVIDRRSGYCTYVWGNLVTWRSKKQSVVSRSSAEAKFRALALRICEGIWLKRMLCELKFSVSEPMKAFCDNQSTSIVTLYHDRSKHVEIDRHFIKEKIEVEMISLLYIPTNQQQIADILTKVVQRKTFEDIISKLGLINMFCSVILDWIVGNAGCCLVDHILLLHYFRPLRVVSYSSITKFPHTNIQ